MDLQVATAVRTGNRAPLAHNLTPFRVLVPRARKGLYHPGPAVGAQRFVLSASAGLGVLRAATGRR